MKLSDLRSGDHFALVEYGTTAPFMAEEDAHVDIRDGDEYVTVMARNMLSDISIPLSVHKEYQYYLKIEPLYWSDKPDVKLFWKDDK